MAEARTIVVSVPIAVNVPIALFEVACTTSDDAPAEANAARLTEAVALTIVVSVPAEVNAARAVVSVA